MASKNKSASNFGSQFNRQDGGLPMNQLVQWYSEMYKHRSNYRKAPSYLPQYKESHPYRLVITKIMGLALNKKSANSEIYISISGMVFTQKFQMIARQFFYQYYEAVGRGDSKWDVPVSFYFHSKIDKNYEGLYLSLRIKAIEMKGNTVENIFDLGTAIIANPLIEEENKIVSVFKELDEAEFGYSSVESKTKTLNNTSPTTLQYTLQSLLQLKKLVRLVPQNILFSHQDCINGIYGSYLPKQIQRIQIAQAQSIQITVTFLQIHISQKFQQDLIGYMKKIYPSEKGIQIKNRRAVVGFHNILNLVNPSNRKLQQIDKEIVGTKKIYIFEGLKEGEIIKIAYYNDNNCNAGVITVGLIYEIAGKEVQIACYFFIPTPTGEEISDKMMIGPGYGSMHQMLPLGSNEIPTLILQYTAESKEYEILSHQPGEIPSFKSPQGKGYANEEIIQKQRDKLKQEIEKERLQIMRQKEEMEKVKTSHHTSFQAEFERKFEVEKENLYKRQQMIQNQYKEQVEKEIREKAQLEQEIRKMSDKLKNLEDTTFKKMVGEGSYAASPKTDHFAFTPPSHQQTGMIMPALRQRLDPGYMIEPQNSIPVKKVRQILSQAPKINQELLKISDDQFNSSSKFTFSFISIIWQSMTEAPKNIYLIVRFFNNRQFQTDTISYLQQGQQGYHQLVRMNNFLKGYQNKQPSYAFIIDPSEYHQPAVLQKDLTNYLAYHNAIIDVFCGQTHIYIGQINIKLKQLLRGNRTQALIAKQLNLVKLKDKQVLGVMQILIKNEQIDCKQQISVKHQQKMKDIKKKIVSNNPIFISNQEKKDPNQSQSENKAQPIRNKANNANRQQLRIQKFKEQKASKNFALTTNNFLQLGQPQKGAVLGQIVSYKQKKMQDYIKGVYEGLLSEKITISAHYGKAVTFPFVFVNRSQSPSSYKVSILSMGSQKTKELVIVKSNKQWRYIAASNNYNEPRRYDMIGQKDTFFLQPGQNIPLVFKFLTFESNSQRSNKEKMINVTICKQDNNWIAGGFSLIVQTHEQVIHHSYVLYEPGEQIVDLIVPVIYSDTQNNSNPKRLHLTDSNPNSTAQWLNPYQILIRTTTPKIMDKIRFNLLLYEDQYFCDLKQNWLIEIYSYEGVCASFRNDFNTRFKITLPWTAVPAHLGLLSFDKVASSLKLYSSSSGLVFKNDTIDLEDDRRNQGGYEIWCELIGSQNNKRSFEITCVSGEQNELIYGWVITVYPYIPRS